ncbi:MAG: nitrous oxide reductase family maturation protein NosD [Ginsengibacter sp.]
MNNKIKFNYGFLCLVSILLLTSTLSAKTILVGKSRATTSIKEGIKMARHGDTILVDKGVYKEGSILVDKEIILKGIGQPIIDGEFKGTVLTVRSNYATVEGFKIINGGRSETKDLAGILVHDSYGVTILNNILDNTNFGILFQNVFNSTIKNNKITGENKLEAQSGNGIHCWRSDSLLIIGNTITGHRDGLYFEFVRHSLIWRNISTKNIRYGIHFMFSHYDTYIGNVFEENESGVAVMFTTNIHMYNNHFINNWGDAAYGILLKEISDSEISGNYFNQNTVGIVMDGCSRIKMEKNRFYNNGWALKISSSSDDNVITNNNFIGNTFDISTNGSLVLNDFNGNYWDKYEGYDINKDKIGDVPYRPVSMYSMIIENNPAALMLFRSLIVTLLDKSEKILPGITPEQLKDDRPLMNKLAL